MTGRQLVSAWEISGYTDDGQLIDQERFDGPAHLWDAATDADNAPAAVAVLLAFAATKTLQDFVAAHPATERVRVFAGVRPYGHPDQAPLRCLVDAELALHVSVQAKSISS